MTKLNAWPIWENKIIITVVTRAALVLFRDTIVFIIAYISGLGFPGGSVGKKIHLQCRSHRKLGFGGWDGKIPWRRAWQPTPGSLPGESPWTEAPGGLQCTGSQRARHD